MKIINLIAVLMLTATCNQLFCQDVIVLKNGDEIKSKVLEINVNEIKYKKIDNLDGPIISIIKSDVFMIKYQNGTKDVINTIDTAPATKQSESKRYENMNFGLYLNPLGFLQFGPIVGVEIPSGANTVVDAHVRLPSLGLLSYVIAADNYDVTPNKISGLGVGGGLKYTMFTKKGGLYVGPLAEYGWATQTYHVGEANEYNEWVKYVVFVANLGYKFRFSSGFYMNAGAYLGSAYIFQDKWQYRISSVSQDGTGKGVMVFGMLELGLGVEF